MTAARPCVCDRFSPGRPLAARDCAKCWLFAHRPAVRRAWGGDPAGCAALPAVGPDMPAATLAGLLAGPRFPMPDGWRLWPVTRAAHLLLTDQFLSTMPAYPAGRYAGRGAVICGGGGYEASAYVACRMLRQVGWRHPIQVWHRGPADPVGARIRRLPGVEVVDAEAHPARPARRTLGGWEGKMFAAINSPFADVLVLDADCYPIFNPDECFEPEHNPHGFVTWPDTPGGDANPQWASYGLTPDGKTALSGGYYVIDKRRAWPVLQLAQHYDDHSDYYYCQTWACVGDVGGYGDQDQVRAALHRLGFPYHRYTERPLLCAHDSYIHAGPGGRPLFVHRHFNKFAPTGQFSFLPKWSPGHLPMEATAWRYFLEWMTDPDPADTGLADEVPGRFSRAEYELWARACRGRDVLELGRQLSRGTVVAAVAGRRVVSLDTESMWTADHWLQRFGVRHKVWLREGRAAALLPSSGGPFSACLVDVSRDPRTALSDIAAAVPHLAPGALIGFHDYDASAHPEVTRVVDAAAARYNWRHFMRADSLAVFVTPETGGQ